MFRLDTSRLLILQTTLEVVEKRLLQDQFTATLQGLEVHFPPEWPGDALPVFAGWAEYLRQNPQAEDWGGILVERATRTAVGQMGCKGLPDLEGTVEIGYGLNPSVWGRGYATEAVQALVAWLWQQNRVKKIKAETQVENLASRRVLEKCGFVQEGTRQDPEDGALIVWEHRR
ncbi:MAG: GNAT family N-acetyltransferase [Meiothermus sp.]|nr:GNAT family N-acetyltransferase [Meiothermus sp.]